MNNKTLKKSCLTAMVVYCILAVAFYFIGGKQLYYRDNQSDMLTPNGVIGEITSEMVITQNISLENDLLTGLSFIGATYARQNTGTLQIEVLSGAKILGRQTIDVAGMTDNEDFYVPFSPHISIPLHEAQLRITAPQSSSGNAVTLYYGNAMSASRTQVAMDLGEDGLYFANGAAGSGALCIRIYSRQNLWFGEYYWYLAGAGLFLLAAYCAYLILAFKRGSMTLLLRVCVAFNKYSYLIKQLVARDFKTKYKRSVLGILWSFLNPLLTMTVQYIVFSTLFKSDIPNFAVYLLTGIVCYSFFSESTTMALGSIVGNASLITKVYVPKYIYPLTRVISSVINLLLSFIPLLGVLLVTRTPIRPAILLLPFGVFCLFALSLGVGMLLSSAMVFFRDTQFLWGVVSMLWMYATPIFYPESILPDNLMPLFKMNPLYQIIRFIRIVLISGVSPEPKAYALALLASIVPLMIGAAVFKKTQDRFVLNI